MGIFTSILGAFRSPGAPPRDEGLQSGVPSSYGTEAAATVNFDSAMQISAVWAAVRIIAETIGTRSSPSLSDAAVQDHVATQDALAAAEGAYEPTEIMDRLRGLMWRHAGILRDEDGLIEGLRQLQTLRADAEDLSVQAGRTSRRYERAQNVRFMLTTAETILRGALERSESRGAHARTDYDEKNRSWRQNIRCVPTAEGMEIDFRPPGVPSNPVQRAVDEEHELDYHHLE